MPCVDSLDDKTTEHILQKGERRRGLVSFRARTPTNLAEVYKNFCSKM